MIDSSAIIREMGTGLSAVCSHCVHWHNALDRDGVAKSCGKKCGGPAQGMAFPLYNGPLNGNLESICFICGQSAQAMVCIGGGRIGVCTRAGLGGHTCEDRLRAILSSKRVIVREVLAKATSD
jgi:hypothetical protein